MNSIINCIRQLSKELNVDIYLVGGTIRDLLINRKIQDLDFVIRNHHRTISEETAKRLQGSFVILSEKREVYRVVLKNGIALDFTKMQGDNIKEDLSRRDFTINAMAYDIGWEWPINDTKIIDPFNGIKDIREKAVRHIHKEVFKEDPLRMLRAVRLMAQLDFDLDKKTIERIRAHASKIDKIAGERITEELFKILEQQKTYYYFKFMEKELGLLQYIFPEIKEMQDIGECKYHIVDSWTHSIYTMKTVEGYIYEEGFFEDHIKKAYEEHSEEVIAAGRKRLQLMKLGALFHDVGKPSAKRVDETGRVRFKGHEITGADIIRQYSDKLKLSTKEREILSTYVAQHMWPLVLYKKNDVSGKALYKVFCETGKETLDILLIALGDIVATRRILEPKEEMGMFKVHIEYIANNYLTRYKPIEEISHIITGEEVMEILDIPEGARVGDILNQIKKAIYFGEIAATKEAAIKYLKEGQL